MKWFYSLIAIVMLTQMFHLTTSASLPPQVSTEFITAHRGSSQTAPENTLRAIRQAIKDKAGIVEIDVRLTADGVIVLSHDNHLKRTAGIDLYVSESSYEQLRHVNVAHYKYFGREKLPTLAEALEITRDQVKVNIELKTESAQPGLPVKVVELVKSLGLEEQCIITSFDREALHKVREVSDLTTGIIIGNKANLTQDIYSDPNIDILSLRASMINRSIMKNARDHHLKVFAWTVNRKDQMKDMMKFQVDSIITDKPATLYQLLH